jgi:hypothetical protein
MNFLLFLVPIVLVFGQYLRSTSRKPELRSQRECLDCDA